MPAFTARVAGHAVLRGLARGLETRLIAITVLAGGAAAAAGKRRLPPRQPSREAETAMTIDPRQLLLGMFEAAVGAALPEKCLPPHLPPRPPGRVIVVGAGKAGGAMAKAVEDHWRGPLEGLVVTALWPWRALPTHRSGRSEPPGPGRRRARSGETHSRHGQGSDPRGPGALPDFRRRLSASRPARRWRDARRQAGHQQGSLEERRDHLRDELRAPAFVGDQGRQARRRRRARACGDPHDLGCAGRRSLRDRLGADRRRSNDLGRGNGDPAKIRHRRAGERPRAS